MKRAKQRDPRKWLRTHWVKRRQYGKVMGKSGEIGSIESFRFIEARKSG